MQKKTLWRVRCLLLLWMIPSAALANTLLVLGDSISAAYGIDRDAGWVALLQTHIAPQGWQVVNASISGDTTGGGLARLPGLLQAHRPQVVIIELGGNDGLRGYPIATLRDNLLALVETSQAQGARVLLAGMEIPPNYGPRYTRAFRDSYREVAEQTRCALLPFLLAGVAIHPEQMQEDGIHPHAEAQASILQNVLPHLTPLLESTAQRASPAPSAADPADSAAGQHPSPAKDRS